jgi:phthiodiolone/phenolphthiodiolone dimycocerosates ketoreductase
MAIEPAFVMTALIGEDSEIAEILEAPLVKSLVLQIPANVMAKHGFKHPMGDDWRGIHDIDPGKLPREKIVWLLKETNVDALRKIFPCGTPKEIARIYKGYADAGMRVPKMIDYGGMAGTKFAVRSAKNVREAEDELLRLVG